MTIKYSLKYAYDLMLEDEGQVFVYQNGEVKNWQKDQRNIHIFPGSFNPIHAGHRFISDQFKQPLIAASLTSIDKFYFETSITRVDKPPVSYEELAEKLSQFEPEDKVVLTNAPRMIQKIGVLSCLFGGLTIHVGIDTIKRMITDYSMIGIGGLDAEFAVYDRKINGKLEIWPPESRKTYPSNVWRSHHQPPDDLLDISSTKIREEWNEKLKQAQKSAADTAASYVKDIQKKEAEFWENIAPDIHHRITRS